MDWDVDPQRDFWQDGAWTPTRKGAAFYGVEVVNMAQGGAGFMLPMLCGKELYELLRPRKALRTLGFPLSL